jgi:hypothetical protein
MKKSLSVLVVIALFICPTLKGQIDNAKEEAAIKAVIEGEINASFNGDYDTWASFFVHEPYVVWMQAWKDGYISYKGWQDVSSSAKTWVKPERKGTIIFNGNYDYTIKIYGNVAFVSFKCKSTRISEGQSTESEAMEARFLEKHDGNWKIAYLSSIYMSTYKED